LWRSDLGWFILAHLVLRFVPDSESGLKNGANKKGELE